MHLKLISLLIFLVLISSTGYDFYGEVSALEFLQVGVLSFCLFILISNKRGFLESSSKFNFSIKALFFIFLIYEELSFLTLDLSNTFNTLNDQSEINLHNLKIFQEVFIYFEIPSINYSAHIVNHVVVTFLALLFLQYGSYFAILKNINLIFLEKNLAPYLFIYILSIVFNSLNIKLNLIPSVALHPEFVELFLYFVLLSDTILKIKKLK